MKLNPKVYNQLKGTPFMSQNIDGVLVEFFTWMIRHTFINTLEKVDLRYGLLME